MPNKKDGRPSFLFGLMMVLVVRMMLVVGLCHRGWYYLASLLKTRLSAWFYLEGYVIYTIFFQFVTYMVLYLGNIPISDKVHRCIMALPIHTPYMHVVKPQNSVDFFDFRFDFLHANPMRCFFEENIRRFF